MRISLPSGVPLARSGGVAANFELLNALCRRGHTVALTYLEFYRSDGSPVLALPPTQVAVSAEDITWFEFEQGFVHHSPEKRTLESFDLSDLPDADILWTCLAEAGRDKGLPVIPVHGVINRGRHGQIHAQPCPKICVSHSVMRILEEMGDRPERLIYVPNGIDHGVYRVETPLHDREPIVCMRWDNYLGKGYAHGFEALTEAHRVRPELRAVLFGTGQAPDGLPDWMTFEHSPSRHRLVSEVYNRSRILLNPSDSEGFGLVSIEAMASGCALVTADNGGSDEFATHGESALVCDPGDIAAMSRLIVELLVDTGLQESIAAKGGSVSRTFHWERSADLCEEFLFDYLADPERFC